MKMQLLVILEASDTCREIFPDGPDTVTLGPFEEFIQITDNVVRSGPGGEFMGVSGVGLGGWWRYQGHVYSDIVIAPVTQGKIQHGDDPIESQGEK